MMTLSEIQAWVAEQPSLDAETLLKAKAHVIAYWNTLQDGTAEYTEARLYYESLMAKGKANAGVTPEMKKAKLVLDGLCEQGQLSLLVEQIGPVVAMGHVKSLEEVLATICAVQRGTVLTMAAKSLGSQGEIEAFTMLLDQKIKAKIEARLKGTKGELYKAAYAEAVAKYGGALPIQAETTPVVVPAKKKKVKPVAKSTWVDVSDSMVLVPKTIQGNGPPSMAIRCCGSPRNWRRRWRSLQRMKRRGGWNRASSHPSCSCDITISRCCFKSGAHRGASSVRAGINKSRSAKSGKSLRGGCIRRVPRNRREEPRWSITSQGPQRRKCSCYSGYRASSAEGI